MKRSRVVTKYISLFPDDLDKDIFIDEMVQSKHN